MLPIISSSPGAPHGALVPIAYGVLSANASTFNFLNIPQIYQDLMVVVNAKNTTSNYLFYTTANASGGNYSGTYLRGDGASATSGRLSNDNICITDYPAGMTTGSIFGSYILHFINYANTSLNKSVLSRYSGDTNGAGSTILSASLIKQTAGISVIGFGTGGGQLAAGSTFELFGIRSVGQ